MIDQSQQGEEQIVAQQPWGKMEMLLLLKIGLSHVKTKLRFG
jgi:hypothetical protein